MFIDFIERGRGVRGGERGKGKEKHQCEMGQPSMQLSHPGRMGVTNFISAYSRKRNLSPIKEQYSKGKPGLHVFFKSCISSPDWYGFSRLGIILQTERSLAQFWSVHMPGLQARSQVGGMRETTNRCFSPSLSLSTSL